MAQNIRFDLEKEINPLFIFVTTEVFHLTRMNLEFIDFALYSKGFILTTDEEIMITNLT